MAYVWLFLQIVFYTLGAVVLCGLAVRLCEMLYLRLMGGAGTVIVKVTSIIGTPVHELGHALMCLLFGHKIKKMALWQPNNENGTLGYVAHKYNPHNLYQVLGNLFIGIGPIFSGLGVLTVTLLLCFPVTLDAYVSSAAAMVSAGENGFALFAEGLKMLPHMIDEFYVADIPVWCRVIGLLVMLSVALHVNLSAADIKGALSAVPLYLCLVLIVTVVTSLLGATAMTVVAETLALFNAYMMSMFVIVLVFSAIHVAVALVIWLLQRILFHG